MRERVRLRMVVRGYESQWSNLRHDCRLRRGGRRPAVDILLRISEEHYYPLYLQRRTRVSWEVTQ